MSWASSEERGRGKTFVDRRPDFLQRIWRRRPGR